MNTMKWIGSIIVMSAAAFGWIERVLGDAPSAKELDAQVLQARRDLQSGEVEFQVVSRKWGRDSTERLSELTPLAIFDGDRLRVDRVVKAKGADGDTIELRATKYVVGDGHRIVFHQQLEPKNRVEGLRIDALTEEISTSPYVFDARLLGLGPGSFYSLHAGRMDAFVGGDDRRNVTVAAERLNGSETWRVEYERPSDGSHARYWIDPGKRYSLVKAEADYTRRGNRNQVSMECTVKLWPEGEVWYPETVVYRHRSNDRLTVEETTHVVRARFNHKIDPATFTLSTMDVPPGTGVLELPHPPGPSRMWDGETLVPRSGGPDPAAGVPAARRRGWLYVSLALGLGAAACIALYVWRRTRR